MSIYTSDYFDRSIIFLHRLKRQVDFLINFLVGLLGLFGLLSLIYYLYSHQEIFGSPQQFFYLYQDHNLFIRIFLISLLADLFLVYRFNLIQADFKKINKKAKEVDALSGLSEKTFGILSRAFILADRLDQPELTNRHLFLALLEDSEVGELFARLNLAPGAIVDKLKKYIATEEPFKGQPKFSSQIKASLSGAYQNALSRGAKAIGPTDILKTIYGSDELIDEILFELEITPNKIDNAIKWFEVEEKMRARYNLYRSLSKFKPKNNMNRAYTAIATPVLDSFSHDLTLMAKYGYFSICLNRQKEIQDIFEALESGHEGVLLVGPPGVGKRAIVEGLAQLMVEEDVPEFLQDKRLVEIDLSLMVGGVEAAEAESRLLTMVSEVERSGNIILYIENLEAITGFSAGDGGSLDLAGVLAETLSNHGIYCLASVSSENYTKYLENKNLGRVMSTVGVEEFNKDQTIQVLESRTGILENKYQVYVDYNAIEAAVDLSLRYINDKFLPTKAIELLEATVIRVSKEKTDKFKICSRDDIATTISEQTGIPSARVSEGESEKLLHLEEKIAKRLIGQEEAVKAISSSLRRARAEMRETKRPIASFLFLGPTGVGKTELAKTVSETYFGSEDYMIRLDMSEYQLADSLKKMIGDPDGTLGYLTEAVRKKPFTLVLLDEVEKAHPDILNLLLQVLEDGRLTDGQGRTISFNNSIIVATSNAGALYIEEAVKNKVLLNTIKQEIIDNQLNKFLRPELINRFDGIIVFTPLTPENVVSIARLLMDKIKKNLSAKGIGLLASEEGLRVLAGRGYDPKFGARPLRRLLQDEIENEIANLILAKKLKRRDIVVITEGGGVAVKVARAL